MSPVCNADVAYESAKSALHSDKFEKNIIAMKTNRTVAALALAAAFCFAGCEEKSPEQPQTVEATSVTISPDKLSLTEGETGQLSAEVLPENTTDKTVIWSSDNESVATVSEDGLVTAIAEGLANITARCGKATANCPVEVKAIAVVPAAIGDYYYSDGTWSTELNASKEVIGIVFWTGNPSDEDPVLAKEHPECANGLAVAISGDETSAWQEQCSSYAKTIWSWAQENTEGYVDGICYDAYSADDNLNKKLGYNNTKVAEAFNAGAGNGLWPVNAVEKAVKYRETAPAPETSSDWYLPSAKELSLLCSGQVEDNIYDIYGETGIKDLVNEKLAAVSGAAQLQSEYYWSSTECYSYNYVVEVAFGSGSVGDIASKSGSANRVRFILAF